MRPKLLALSLLGIVAASSTARAQVYSLPTAPPRVTAARAEWQTTRRPIFYAGRFYHATGPTEFFNGHVMVRTGTYRGVPLYENGTLEPYSLVFVPIGGNLVRPYERMRDRDLSGTVGSRMPSFPIERNVEAHAYDWIDDFSPDAPPEVFHESQRAQWYWPSPVDRSQIGSDEPLAGLSSRTAAAPVVPAPTEPGKPRETTNAGAYITFKGVRYYTSGRAVTHDIQRFARVGDVGRAAVFTESGGSDQTVFVEVVPGGPLAPYTKREPAPPAKR